MTSQKAERNVRPRLGSVIALISRDETWVRRQTLILCGQNLTTGRKKAKSSPLASREKHTQRSTWRQILLKTPLSLDQAHTKYEVCPEETPISSPFVQRLLIQVFSRNYLCVLAEVVSVKTPGPGTYQPIPSISPKGHQFFSRFESSGATLFNPPCSARFKEFSMRLSGIM